MKTLNLLQRTQPLACHWIRV